MIRRALRKLLGLGGRTSPPGRRLPIRLTLESLEDRTVLTTFTVTSPSDSGPTTLRTAITNANATPGDDIIEFNFNQNQFISLTSELPYLSSNITIRGLGADKLTVRRSSIATNFRVFTITSGVNVTLSGLKIENGSSDFGGGIQNSGTLLVDGCWITGNEASQSGGGIVNLKTMTLQNSTVSNNRALFHGGIQSAANGSDARLNAFNSTISGNTATSTAANSRTSGGADAVAFTAHQSILQLTNCTLSGNTAANGLARQTLASRLVTGATVEVLLERSILDGAPPNSSLPNAAAFNGGAVGSFNHNVSTDSSGNLSATKQDKLNANPRLGPLDLNARPMPTHALLPGSAAIDAGPSSLSGADQLGSPRTVGAASDSGAIEFDHKFRVTSVGDSGANTLRQAILDANATAGADEILLSATGAIDLLTALPDLSSDINLKGPGAEQLTVRRSLTLTDATSFRVFTVPDGATVSISGLTISRGRTNVGGAIRNDGVLTVDRSWILDNTATSNGGGIYTSNGTTTLSNSTVSGNIAANGGGLFNLAFGAATRLTVLNSTVSDNTATANASTPTAGGIDTIAFSAHDATTELIHSTVAGNAAAVGANATQISVRGNTGSGPAQVRLANTILAGVSGQNNAVKADGGQFITQGHNISSDGTGDLIRGDDRPGTDPKLGILFDNGGPTPTRALASDSPAIDNGVLSTAGGLDQRGVARGEGAAPDIGAFEFVYPMTVSSLLDDGGANTLRAAILRANATPGFDTINITATGTIDLLTALPDLTDGVSLFGPGADKLTVRRASASAFRIFTIAPEVNALITDMKIADGSADFGGGIYNQGGFLTVSRCWIADNTAVNNGGGIYNQGGTTILNRITVSGNTARFGGGIMNTAFEANAFMSVDNSTISNNRATATGGGFTAGGAVTQAITTHEATLQLTNSTIADNTATGTASARQVFAYNEPGNANVRVVLKNTLLAGAASSQDNAGAYNGGQIVSQGNNLNTDNSGGLTGTGDLRGVTDLLLGDLGNNGGPTPTRALLPGSVGINVGDPSLSTNGFDQRGMARSEGGRADIGAFELADVILVTTLADNGVGSLRAAIQKANVLVGDNEISIQVMGTITLTSELPALSNVSLSGFGADDLTIFRSPTAPDFRIFTVPAGVTASISGMTLSNGRADRGGGILNDGDLSLAGVWVNGNTATGSGGGIYNRNGTLSLWLTTVSNNSAPVAGGIRNVASGADALVMIDTSTVSDNIATSTTTQTAGGIESIAFTAHLARVELTYSTVADNSASLGQPAHQVLVGTSEPNTGTSQVVLANTILAGPAGQPNAATANNGQFTSQGHNLSTDGTGGLTQATDKPGANAMLDFLQNNGGSTPTRALLAGSAAIDAAEPNTAFFDQRGVRRTQGAGPDIGAFEFIAPRVVSTLADAGAGSLREAITQANALNGTVTITFAVEGTIQLTSALPTLSRDVSVEGPGADRLTIRRNAATDFRIFSVGGGATVSISGLTITNGRADFGGGIQNFGTLTISDCWIVGNTATSNGGGIYSQNATLSLQRSTVSGNSSPFVGGIVNSANGANASTSIINSTISSNESTISTNASTVGGVHSFANTAHVAMVFLTNATVADNTAASELGVLQVFASKTLANGIAQVFLKNSILANASSGLPNAGVQNGGLITSQGNNLSTDTSGGLNQPGDLPATDPRLGPLQNNGGTTPTHALLPGSPALDAGDNDFAGQFDQRGVVRSADGPDPDTVGTADLGAFEARPSLTDIPNQNTPQDTPLVVNFQVGSMLAAGGTITATSSNPTLVLDANLVVSETGGTRTLTITPAAGRSGQATISVRVTRDGQSMTDTFVLSVAAAPPAVTATSTATVAPVPVRLSAVLITKKVGKKQFKFVKITSSDGTIDREIRSSFQGPTFRNIAVAINTVGTTDQVELSGRKGKKTMKQILM